ncbi:protachykinin-1 isoform X1 [Amblyraja radiata]|uniref:protachykinin-like isoform X1 n=1 Tax=Amblyraja radiata TaxID=386614 RepID=UPI0014021572|nr:protachykinin-like isoform X1 [Amblyraja radiata]XP_032898111.1 protachykinin-1 isoform X1 [Amblyraja radiata]
MRSHRLLALTAVLLILTEVFCEEISPNEDTSHWIANNHSQEKRLKANSVRELLRRMTRKPRPAQFYGLMGRRSLGNKPLTRKRHKLESFVGLMGKRSSASGSPPEWVIQDFIQRH